jgi:endonuclease YncB( thermonuclease family)
MFLSYKLTKSTKDTKEFSLNGKKKLCKVVDVYDGDTCKVVFRHCRKLYRWNIRMAGYDSPEMRLSLNTINREEKKQLAVDAKLFLSDLILNKLVYIHCGEFDKYGRLLGSIYLKKRDDKSVNDIMVEEHYGYIYNGGTKKVNPQVYLI